MVVIREREIPEGFVLDHKEGKSNDIDNLRLATVSQNAQNSKLMSNNTSGHKVLSWLKVVFGEFAYLHSKVSV